MRTRKISCGLVAFVALAAAGLMAASSTHVRAQSVKPEAPRAGQSKPATKALSPAEQRRQLLAGVQSWGYQLRLIRFPEINASPFDLVVIDHALAAQRRFVREYSPDLINEAKKKPDGSRRIVLAYLSIGEAERYRFYWNQDWYDPAKKPAWLGDMNPVWEGNYLVRFWDPAWQSIILDGPESYLGRIQAAGFDGIYLDRGDVHSEWVKENPNAEDEMARFIQKIAMAARASDPNFLVVMQNAEELIERRAVRDAIDAIAKEDLYYGIDHKASPNDPETIEWSLKLLRKAKKAGQRVLVVEYLSAPETVRDVRQRAEAEGFLVHFTVRDLGDLSVIAPDRSPAAPALTVSPSGGSTSTPGAVGGKPAR